MKAKPAAPKSSPVFKTKESSNVQEARHDPATNTLKIKFKGGASYEYSNIEKEQFEAFKDAESHGGWVRENLILRRNTHPARRLPEPKKKA